MTELSVDLLRELFEYRDGTLFWKKSRSPSVRTGDKAGWLSCAPKKGRGKPYLRIQIGTKNLYLHRVIYAMHHGCWPAVIDHIDGDQLNNRIENLRACTQVQNSSNRALNKRNTTGASGVRKHGGRWQAYIRKDYRLHHLGFFATREEAIQARASAEQRLFGEFIRTTDSCDSAA